MALRLGELTQAIEGRRYSPMGPGFLVDEPVETAGTALQLPWWLESYREDITKKLVPSDYAHRTVPV